MIIIALTGVLLAALASVGAALAVARRRDRRSRRVLQATMNVPRAIAAFENDRLVACNRQFMALMRIPPELGESGTPAARLEQLDTGGLLSDLREQMNRARDANQGFVIERSRVDGAILQQYYSPPVDGIAVFGAEDATVQRQSERFMQIAQKMDALGRLTGGMAHDFNNLLTVVLLNLDAMRGDRAIMEKYGRRIEMMSAASRKGATLISQLLAYARKQPLEAEIVDLREIMPSFADLIRRTLGEDIDVELRIADLLWPTLIDPAQFESTALNLALNARDAMPDGGSLVLELSTVSLSEAYAQQGDAAPGDYVLFSISDSGVGMTPDVVSRAFDPFFTTKGEGRGYGLGLSMAYGFVKQVGGHIKIVSEPGRGTTVKLYFPRYRDEKEAGASPATDTAPATGAETILVVEDDEGLRMSTVDALHDLGYNTLQAANGLSALTLLENEKSVDLLFTDMVLSGAVNGRALAEAARDLQPAIRVLYTSGYTETLDAGGEPSDATIALLSKPYCTDELAVKLKDVMAGNAQSASRKNSRR